MILQALLKARKAERDKLENSKPKITQPDASLVIQ